MSEVYPTNNKAASTAIAVPVEGSAPRWVIDVNGASELVLPEWSE